VQSQHCPPGGLNTFASASRFSCLFDDIRALLRPNLRVINRCSLHSAETSVTCDVPM
jgi:hypothetical protein